jgi:uncharacterized protein with PIN domain
MKKTRERMRAEMMMEAESVIDGLLDEQERWEEPTLMQVEDVILDLRKQLSERMAEVVLQGEESVQPAENCVCPSCGEEMTYKGRRGTTVESRVGVVRLERGYWYCDHCKSGLFPPRHTAQAVGQELE